MSKVLKVALWSTAFLAGNYLTGFRFWNAVFKKVGN